MPENQEIIDLQQFDVTVVEKTSPLLTEARNILEMAQSVTINSPATFEDAIDVKKEINASTKKIKELRLDFTRPIDKFKKSVMAKEDEILNILTDAKTLVVEQIQSYEEEQEKIRLAEVQRVEAIVSRLKMFYRPTIIDVDELQESGKKLKDTYAALDEKDQNNATIKAALITTANNLTARIEELQEAERQRVEQEKLKKVEDEQEKQRLQQQATQDRLDAEKKHQEREEETRKAQTTAAKEVRKSTALYPRSNTTTVTDIVVENEQLVPRHMCSPDMAKIREHVKNTDQNAEYFAAMGIKVSKRKVTR